MQGLLSALQGHMKCLLEVFDLWNLYADYFLRGGLVLFVEQNFVGFGVCFTTLGRQGNSISVYKIFILDTFIPTFIICGGFIFPILIKAVKLSKDELGRLLFIYACELSLINYIIYSIHNRTSLEVLIYLFPQRFGQFHCPSSRRNYNL